MTGIRRAGPSDLGALARLNEQLGYPATESELRERLEPILASGEDALLVAVEDSEPIGWIHVAIERGLEASAVAGLRGLVVDEAHRSGGVGRSLARPRLGGARRFYEREGYVHMKTSNVFSKPLV